MKNQELLTQEYYKVFDVINDFDKRLMTVKGWGVTLSLSALAWGFQEGKAGLFLVAALSGLAFWLIEGTMKRHQMRYYFRMQEIETLSEQSVISEAYLPKIHYSWINAKQKSEKKLVYLFVWLLPHVLLPHIVSVVAGITFFNLAVSGYFKNSFTII